MSAAVSQPHRGRAQRYVAWNFLFIFFFWLLPPPPLLSRRPWCLFFHSHPFALQRAFPAFSLLPWFRSCPAFFYGLFLCSFSLDTACSEEGRNLPDKTSVGGRGVVSERGEKKKKRTKPKSMERGEKHGKDNPIRALLLREPPSVRSPAKLNRSAGRIRATGDPSVGPGNDPRGSPGCQHGLSGAPSVFHASAEVVGRRGGCVRIRGRVGFCVGIGTGSAHAIDGIVASPRQ